MRAFRDPLLLPIIVSPHCFTFADNFWYHLFKTPYLGWKNGGRKRKIGCLRSHRASRILPWVRGHQRHTFRLLSTTDPSLSPSFPSTPNWGSRDTAVSCSLSPQHSDCTIRSSEGQAKKRGETVSRTTASCPRLAAEHICGLLRTDPETCRAPLSGTRSS